MAKLPFIVEPRIKPALETIGSEESGKIQIKRMGYLTTAEKTFTEAQLQSDDSTQKLLTLTRAIGQEFKLDMQKAYEKVSSVLQGDSKDKIDREIQEKHSEELNEIVSSMASAATRKSLVSALAMIVFRVDPEFTADQLMELHPDIVNELSQLYEDEEKRSTERLEQLLEGKENEAADLLDNLEKK